MCKLYKCVKWALIIGIVWIVGFAAWDIRQNNIIGISSGNASIFSDIKDAITGHVDDIIDRQKADEHVTGLHVADAKFTWSSDSIHWAEGTVEIIKQLNGKVYVQLAEDFSAGLAPDLYIYAAKGHITSDAQFVNGEKVELGKLKKGSGASYYEIPAELVKEYSMAVEAGEKFSIVIHCKRFNEPMGAAHF